MGERHVHRFVAIETQTRFLRRMRIEQKCECGMTPDLHLKLLSGELHDLEESLRARGVEVPER